MTHEPQGDWLELVTTRGCTIRVLKTSHPRARQLRLTVTPNGARVSYPRGMRSGQVYAFLRSQAGWLERKLAELNVQAKPTRALHVGTPAKFTLRGEPTALHWAEGPYPRVEAREGQVTLVIPRPNTRALPVARGLLAMHLESLIRRDVSRWLALYVPQLGLAPTSIRVRSMKSLWGSLDTRDRINLDLALALAPPAALRYVVVHELCHLKERNHSPRFWAQVEKLLPAWHEQRDWLRQHGAPLKFELDRLVADMAD